LGAVSWPVTFVGAELGCWAAVLGGREHRIWSLEGVGAPRSSAAGQSAIRSRIRSVRSLGKGRCVL